MANCFRHGLRIRGMMTKKFHIATLAVGAVVFTASIAFSHPVLKGAVPQADMSAQSPQEIRLTFSEALVAKFSGLELKDQDGKRVETGPAASDPKDKKQLLVPLKSVLAPGRYTVEWHVVSEDTHRMKGSYSFEVKP